jgi:3',5'-cyclic AMP phosphodiesterase CpdA
MPSNAKVIAHLSDVHFGREDPEIVRGLLRSVAEARPDIVVVSGDLTQRAKKKQFRAAAAFLKELPRVPRIVVPGNHDVSATNLLERMTRPLRRYRRFITGDLAPSYVSDEVAIAGINTVRLFARKDGRINTRQVARACEQLAEAPAAAFRVVVTHHPMDLPLDDLKHALVSRSAMAMRSFAKCGVDLFLSGHLHAGHTVATSARYRLPGWSAIVAQAGTAVSTRTRGENNGWNLIRLSPSLATPEIAGPQIDVRQMVWSGKTFVEGATERYRKGASGWSL